MRHLLDEKHKRTHGFFTPGWVPVTLGLWLLLTGCSGTTSDGDDDTAPATTLTPPPASPTPSPAITPSPEPAPTPTPVVESTPTPVPDKDGDGYREDDCDDWNPDAYPGADEVPYDGTDQDCDGRDLTDVDSDGHDSIQVAGDDCDDSDPDAYPGADEVPYDGIDQDCDGFDLTDVDIDGYESPQVGGDDCDDADPATYPGATEVCDGEDNDCDGDTDEDVLITYYLDEDGDGYGDPDRSTQACDPPENYTTDGEDCDDHSATSYPGANEAPYDGIDQDCDGTDLTDIDSDGHEAVQVGGDDCDDWNPDAYPGADEVPYDGTDQDCDGKDLTDVDGDGHDSIQVAGDDCDDSDPDAYPGADEVPYDGTDQDCDGFDLTDVDIDGHDSIQVGGDDCDDSDPTTYPGATEVCDGEDNDCDGDTDEGVLITYYLDNDGDGYGTGETVSGCSPSSPYTATFPGDCDDTDAAVNPGATEICNDGIDNDCDGENCQSSGILNLSQADAKFVGENNGDGAGWCVSGAGDVNGDGYDDILIGAAWEATQGDAAGAAYLVLGPVSGTLDLSEADAKFVGEDAGDSAGYSVSSAGDVNGDGYDDILIGAAWEDSGGKDAGAAYLINGPVTGTLNLSEADAKFVGEHAGDVAAISVSGAGDVNGDGYDDILIGAAWEDSGGIYAGAAYLVLGPVSGTLDLSEADAKFVGEHAGDFAGWSVSGAGDVNGDGYDDLLIGAFTESGEQATEGAAYLIDGPVTGTLNLSEADAKLTGEHEGDEAGASVSSAGDVNGDGYDDILIGAEEEDTGGEDAGAAYLVLGKSP